ncbi:MAG: hypothetical protein ACPG49_04265 [Chitinophagales bacterium]
MKTASSELFDLIHSLTGRERAYFKRFAGIHKHSSSSNYLKLFDAILKQETYDETALKKQFEKDKLSRYFPRAKKYLYDKILESMRLFHAEASLSVQLKLQINSARFLYSKKLFKQAMKKAQQIKKDAEAAEYWAEYLAALEIETSILCRTGYKNTSYKDLQEFGKAGTMALSRYGESYKHYCLERQMTYLLGRGGVFDGLEIESIFQKVLLDEDLKGVSPQIQRLYTLALYSENYSKKPQDAIRYYESAADLMETHPTIMEKGVSSYLFFIGRLLQLGIDQSSFQANQSYLQKIKTNLLNNIFLDYKGKEFEFVVKADYYYYSLLCLFEFGEHEQILSLMAESREELLKSELSEIHPAHQLRFPYIYMLIHFFQGEFEAALESANAVFEIDIDLHPVKDKVRLWLLFIHFELEHYDLLEHLIRNTIRYWKKQKTYDETRQFWIEVLQKMLRTTCELEVWRGAYEYLTTQNVCHPNLNSNRWNAYVLSKLENKPLKEVHHRLIVTKKLTVTI